MLRGLATFRGSACNTAIQSTRTFRTSPIARALLSEVIKTHHREIEDAYTKALNGKTHDEKQRWGNQFTWELARHAIGEDLVLYPAVEKHLPDGKELAHRDRVHTNEVKFLLNDFQKLKADDPDFDTTLKTVIQALDAHIKEEEAEDLPKLEEVLSKEDSEAAGREFHVTRQFVPTRSHPLAPDKPPFETVVGLLAAPIDKLGDLFRKFPREKS